MCGILSPRSSHRSALRRSSPGYVVSRRQVAPLFPDISEQDAAAAALKREWLAIRRQEHRESLRRRSCLTSPRSLFLMTSELEDSFSGPPQPPLILREHSLTTNGTGGARRGARRDETEAAMEAGAEARAECRIPTNSVLHRLIRSSSGDLERQAAKHQWLAQAWESQRRLSVEDPPQQTAEHELSVVLQDVL